MEKPTYKQAIAAAFSAVAETYGKAAHIEHEIGIRLLDKLVALKPQPNYILDLGCGPASFYAQLHQLYPHATIIGLDIAFAMLNFAKTNSNILCCADAEFLPFFDQQFDLVFSNCCFPSIQNLPGLFVEIQRVLKTHGTLLFSTFGPDTLQELGLGKLWPDMHLIGDLLMQQNFKDPVTEMEFIKTQYASLLDLCNDLQEAGSFILDTTQMNSLHSPFIATFEIIYGTATKQNTSKQFKDEQGNIYIPIDKITFL